MADYGFDDLGLHRIIGVTHPGNKASQRVLMKAGLEDAGWGHYYDRRLASLRGRAGSRLTVSGALAQSGLVPLDAQVLLAHVLGKDRAWLVAHGERTDAARALRRVPRAGTPTPGRRAGRLSHRKARILGPVARRLARRADPAPRDGDARRIGARAVAAGPRCARARPRHGLRCHCAGHRARAAAREDSRHGPVGGRARRGARQRAAPRSAPTSNSSRSDWYDGLAPADPFDLIVSNPPYVDGADPHLSEGDVRFEPSARVDAGRQRPRGDRPHRRRRARAPRARRLARRRARLRSVGPVRALFAAAGFADIVAARDLAGIPRVVAGTRICQSSDRPSPTS